jgi:guanylate kinase
MPLPPTLSPEQRQAALEKAAAARRVRAELKEKLKTGSLTLKELLDQGDADEIVGKMKVLAVLESLPGLGKVKARRLMDDVGISETRRLQGLGDQQVAPMILVLSGPGGVGKGTVVAQLLRDRPELWLSRSWTTRQRRPGEPEDAYVFVDRQTFLDRVAAGGFLEWTNFGGNGRLYGTPSLDDAPTDRDVILEIELDGARQVKARHPEAVLVLIVAPTPEDQQQRLRQRGDDEESVARRVRFGVEEEALGRRIADHVVVNDDVTRAAHEVAGIVDKHHSGR